MRVAVCGLYTVPLESPDLPLQESVYIRAQEYLLLLTVILPI